MAASENRNPWKEPRWLLATIVICTLSFVLTLGALSAFWGRMHGEHLPPEGILGLSTLAGLLAAFARHVFGKGNGNGKNEKS